MLINKSETQKTLRHISNFDPQGCPFMGVQLPSDDKPQFHRSSPFGFIQTNSFDQAKPHIFASLDNFKDLLNVSSEVMHMNVDTAGKLRLESNDEYPTRLHVHTVRKEASGYKAHYLGIPGTHRYPGDVFKGFDIRPFKGLAIPPILGDGRLLLSTIAGTVIWDGGEPLKAVKIQPRETFLRFIAGGSPEELLLSNQGYWMAEQDGLVCALAGHTTPPDLLRVYSLAGTELTTFNAPRLISALSNVAQLTSDTDRVEFNPREGILCRDKYMNPQIFPHGASTNTWPKGSVFGRTAKFIVDALSQSKEEIAVLYSVPFRNSTYRLVRGSIEVNFGLI